MSFSRLLNVHQKFPDRRVANIPDTIEMELTSAGFGENLKPGARIAIGVGSRGIANVSAIVRAVVDYWKSRGFSPFLFPSDGQRLAQRRPRDKRTCWRITASSNRPWDARC